MGYFAKIDKPEMLKALILECARDVIILLRKKDQIDALKQEKEDLIKDMELDMDQIKRTIDDLHQLLTNSDVKKELEKNLSLKPIKEHKVKSNNKSSKVIKPLDSSKHDLEVLEKTLNSIENKLKNLNFE